MRFIGDRDQGICDQLQFAGDRDQGACDHLRFTGDPGQGVGDHLRFTSDQGQGVCDHLRFTSDRDHGGLRSPAILQVMGAMGAQLLVNNVFTNMCARFKEKTRASESEETNNGPRTGNRDQGVCDHLRFTGDRDQGVSDRLRLTGDQRQGVYDPPLFYT